MGKTRPIRGGLCTDTFAWELADAGTAGSAATDVITDFDNADASNGGDVLDLRDLLVDETEDTLDEYLYFEESGGNTIVHISSTGGFTDGVYDASAEDQTIEITGVDLTNGFGGDQMAIIQDLMDRGKLMGDL